MFSDVEKGNNLMLMRLILVATLLLSSCWDWGTRGGQKALSSVAKFVELESACFFCRDGVKDPFL